MRRRGAKRGAMIRKCMLRCSIIDLPITRTLHADSGRFVIHRLSVTAELPDQDDGWVSLAAACSLSARRTARWAVRETRTMAAMPMMPAA